MRATDGARAERMDCQICKKLPATVHVTDVATEPGGGPAQVSARASEEQHVCAVCAKTHFELSVASPEKKVKVNIWKLLQVAKQKPSVVCPDCGMSLGEFRSKGRLGCPKDYDLFWPHLEPLLERVHNATSHVSSGEAGGVGSDERQRHLTDLRAKLANAIREEAYEHAAKLRDAIEELERSSSQGG